VRSGPKQLERLLKWAASFPERTWAVENATGLGSLRPRYVLRLMSLVRRRGKPIPTNSLLMLLCHLITVL
jgi:hypothetical protein